jgi:hypothetical protein
MVPVRSQVQAHNLVLMAQAPAQCLVRTALAQVVPAVLVMDPVHTTGVKKTRLEQEV